jgi:DICT domain-containing protein
VRAAELARVLADARAAGLVVALDDLGGDVRSLALLSLIDPDIIKLDLRLVQDRSPAEQASIVAAVAAERERSGAQVLAEGIENEADRSVARSLGAGLGQGWLFGRPGPPAPPRPDARVRRSRAAARSVDGETPFAVVSAVREVREASKRLLMPMSHHLEERARRIAEGAVILSSLQHARRFSPATGRRYEALARRASLVAAFGVGMPAEPVHGVRGVELDDDDPLAREWTVIVLGPHFAGALVARDLGDPASPDGDRRFAYATTYDRILVLAGARALIARITPTQRCPA